MEFKLPAETEQLIRELIASGDYQGREAVVAAGIAALDRDRRSSDFEPGELDQLIAEGEADIERGDVRDLDEAYEQRRAKRALT
jgi:Arc/MetJ-type ribon-helix-helix transcriptional regulator